MSKVKIIKRSTLAFTLFELVIVVLIMGLIYAMVPLNVIKGTKKSVSSLNVSNLADFLRSQKDVNSRTFYLYGNDCQRYLFEPSLDGNVTIKEIVFSKKIEAFWFDSYATMQNVDFADIKEGNFKNKVCLKFQLFSNGSTSPLVIKNKKSFFYHTFFDGTKKFSSLEEASTWIRRADINPKRIELLR